MSVGFENSPPLYCDMSGHSCPKGVLYYPRKNVITDQPITGQSFVWPLAVRSTFWMNNLWWTKGVSQWNYRLLVGRNKAGKASKLPRWQMVTVVYLSVIITNSTILLKIYLALIFRGIRRNKSIHHLKIEYLFMAVQSCFKSKMAAVR